MPVQAEQAQCFYIAYPEPIPKFTVAQVEPVFLPVESAPPPAELSPSPVEAALISAEAIFNPLGISQEVYESTKSDIQELVERLNRLIRARNFNTWVSYLREDYYQKISSREFLNDIVGRFPIFRGRLNNARDYFTHVVVPSRTNDRVDEIEFISENKVRAYTVDSRGQVLVLYNLEKQGGQWKIAD